MGDCAVYSYFLLGKWLRSQRCSKGRREDVQDPRLVRSRQLHPSPRKTVKSRWRPRLNTTEEVEGQASDLSAVEAYNKCCLQAREASVAVSLLLDTESPTRSWFSNVSLAKHEGHSL